MNWEKEMFEISEDNYAFTGDNSLPDEVLNLNSPLEFFLFFFTPDLMQHIAEQSSLFSTQCNPDKPFLVTVELIRKYLGLCIASSVIPTRNVRMYWNNSLSLQLFVDTLPVNLFEKIRANLHFNNNHLQIERGNPGYDRMHKIRPVLESLKKNSMKSQLKRGWPLMNKCVHPRPDIF